MTEPFNYGAYSRGKFNNAAYPRAGQANVTTWANRPSPADVPGEVWRFTDLGRSGFGTFWVSDGTRWLALAGRAPLNAQGAVVTGITNTESILLQALLPVGGWQTNDVLRAWVAPTKSGTTDAATARVRIGTGGTITDTQVVSVTVLAASNQRGGAFFDVKLASATSALPFGTNNTEGSYAGASAAAADAAVAISSAAANALYVSLCLVSGGAADTVGAQDSRLELLTK